MLVSSPISNLINGGGDHNFLFGGSTCSPRFSLKVFLENDADVSVPDSRGMTLLLQTCADDELGLSEILLERACDLEAEDVKGRKWLHLWARSRFSYTIGRAIGLEVEREDVNVNGSDAQGRTLLHWVPDTTAPP